MLSLVGIAVVLVMVFGSYLLAGGKMGVVLHALPHEFMAIGGSAVGALLTGNSPKVVKKAFGGFGKCIKGSKWKKDDYRDLLCLLFVLTKTMKTKGAVAVEAHIEKPEDSSIFQKYPRILHDHFALDFICDSLRMITMDMDDPHQLEDVMDKILEKHHHEGSIPAEALQTMADGLPALGIVAAVLGVIKTMGSITEPPEVLGKMIGGALVGTFLGVFLAYGIVGPFANRYKQILHDEGQFYVIIKDTLVAYLNGNAIQVAVEIGRGSIPTEIQPSFAELESAIDSASSG
ncbi:MAG: flagellar motor stator protein MotA [Alphaproteobacteria bacterium]